MARLLTVSPLILESTESHPAHCSIASQGNETVGNYLSINQICVGGEKISDCNNPGTRTSFKLELTFSQANRKSKQNRSFIFLVV